MTLVPFCFFFPFLSSLFLLPLCLSHDGAAFLLQTPAVADAQVRPRPPPTLLAVTALSLRVRVRRAPFAVSIVPLARPRGAVLPASLPPPPPFPSPPPYQPLPSTPCFLLLPSVPSSVAARTPREWTLRRCTWNGGMWR